MSLKTWIATFWRGTECKQLTIGTSVKTPHGTGRIIGGCVNVQLDVPVPHIHRFSVSHPIEKIEIL